MIKLTEYTKGGGCGCKIAPEPLKEILSDHLTNDQFRLIVGNSTGDDAAVLDLLNGSCLLCTTDFFTPIVDSPYDFGRIAAANSISDVYSMGGRPVMALSILGWPTEKLGTEIASEVIRGAVEVCKQAGIAIGGGHSIETPEPIFGLSVNGVLNYHQLKRNNTSKVGDVIFLTKPIGTGILTSAMKRTLLSEAHLHSCVESMATLNFMGEFLGDVEGVHAMTDVTGFGLIGHLTEMTDQGRLAAELHYANVPLLEGAQQHAANMVYPDNTMRNWKAYGAKVNGISGESLLTLCDPQTNGGLLFSADPNAIDEVQALFQREQVVLYQIGSFKENTGFCVEVN